MALVLVEHHQGFGSVYLARVEGFPPNRDGREEAAEYAAERIADRIIEARGGSGDAYPLDDDTMVLVDVLDFGDGIDVRYCVNFMYMDKSGETEGADEFIIVSPASMAQDATRDAVERWKDYRLGFIDRIK
jgi:hypothetical protein